VKRELHEPISRVLEGHFLSCRIIVEYGNEEYIIWTDTGRNMVPHQLLLEAEEYTYLVESLRSEVSRG
jgi:hypothetical protein